MQRLVLFLVILMATVFAAHALSLGGGLEEEEEEGVRGVEVGKRDGRRITRDRYRMGYMFGKRSNLPDARLLIKALTGKAIPVEEMGLALQTDSKLARRVARHLDRNGDGFISISEMV